MSEPTLSELKELILEVKQGGKVLLNAMQALNTNLQNLDNKFNDAKDLIITMGDIAESLEDLIKLVKDRTDNLPKHGFTRAGARYKAG